MKATEQEIRALRKRGKTWLASLIYYSTRGKINIGTLSQKLQSLFKLLFKPENIQKALSASVPDNIDAKEVTAINKGIMSRLTPNKIHRRMLSYPEITVGNRQTREITSSFILERLLVT